jgi:sarcosine oxidase/L-pipecolate oxidase
MLIECTQNAIHTWRHSPLFSPHYHHTGYLVASSASAPKKATSHISRLIESISSHPDQPKASLTPISSAADVLQCVPQLTGPLNGWSGYFNSHAGYARAAPALQAVYAELINRGVVFHLGAAGQAVAVFPDEDDVKIYPAPRPYVKTADKQVHTADVVIMALGAHTARVLPAAGAQLTAKSWAVGHVRLTADEAARFKNLPVVNCRDLGFFFEPVAIDLAGKEWLIKLCAHGGGYTNKSGAKTSIPPSQAEENDGIPIEDELLIRRLLRETLPEFAKRPLERRFTCWCADTADSEYVIDHVPGYNGLMMAGGDSGHAFKMFPIFGSWVADMVEKGQQVEERWRWKNAVSDGKEDIDWRVGGVKDISEVERRGDGSDERPRL